MKTKRRINVALRVNVDVENVDDLGSVAATIIDRGWNDNSFFRAYLYPITLSGMNNKTYLPEEELFKLVIQSLKRMEAKKKRII